MDTKRRSSEPLPSHQTIAKIAKAKNVLPLQTLKTSFFNCKNYRVHEKIGEGGSGVVFRVTKNKGSRRKKQYAAKVVLKDTLTKSEELGLTRECTALTQLAGQVAGLVRLHKVLETPGEYVLIEELASCDLLTLLEKRKDAQFPEEEAREYFNYICKTVMQVHEKGFVHRDLKLENILVFKRESNPKVSLRIADFGCCVQWRPGAYLDEAVGTLQYASPEVVSSNGLYEGPEIDVWALGVMLYTMVAGEFPFCGKSPAEIRSKIVHGDFQPQHFSGSLKHLLRKIFHPHKDKRITLDKLVLHRWVTRNSSTPPCDKVCHSSSPRLVLFKVARKGSATQGSSTKNARKQRRRSVKKKNRT